jgi:hypothetical protein
VQKLGDLMPRGFGVVGLGLLRQEMAAASAGGRHEGDDRMQTRGRQALLQRRRMSGLGVGFFPGRLFDKRLGRLGWIGGGRQGGVGGVCAELFFEGTDALRLGGESLLQTSDDLITLAASRAGGFVHTRILGMKGANSCPRRISRLNGYPEFSREMLLATADLLKPILKLRQQQSKSVILYLLFASGIPTSQSNIQKKNTT